MSTSAVGVIANCTHHIINFGWIDQDIRTKGLCTIESLLTGIECDHPGAHFSSQQCDRKTNRALPKDCNRLITGELQAL